MRILNVFVFISIGFGLFLLSRPSVASEHRLTGSGPVGAGIMLGEPTGLTLKYWTKATQAFDVGITYSFGSYLIILGDYLWHFPDLFQTQIRSRSSLKFVPYLGAGGAIGLQNSAKYFNGAILGIRVPLGIELLPRVPSIGVFLEVAPGVTLIPAVYAFLQGDVGIRYYF